MCFPSLSRARDSQSISPRNSTPISKPAPQGLGPAYGSTEYNAYWTQQYQAKPSNPIARIFEPSQDRVARQVAFSVWQRLAKDTQISVGYGTGPPDPDVEARERGVVKADQERIGRVDTPPVGAVGQAL